MHAAPSVSYPVGRSRFAGALAGALVCLGAAAALAWSVQSSTPGWRQAAAFAAVLACGALALRGWLASPRGVLHWDGAGWSWDAGVAGANRACGSGGGEGAAAPLGNPAGDAGQVEAALDLQSRMLLRWRADGGPARWLWAERAAAPADWDALRRAVYSRATNTAPRRAQPPAAER